MKKMIVVIGIVLYLVLFNTKVLADEPIEDLIINGLDNIQTEYQAGTNPETIDFTEGLTLFSHQGTLAPDKLLVDIGNVKFDEVGTYEVYYYVIFVIADEEVRFDIATLEIEIIDTTRPVLSGVKPIFVKLNSRNEINYLEGVQASDNDKSSPLEIKVFHQDVDITEVGIYNVNYYVVDKSGNDRTASTYVFVQEDMIDLNLPVISVNQNEFNIKVNEQNAEEIYIDAVSATDGQADITPYVQYDDSGVDYTQLGTYEMIYMVFDEDGHFAKTVVPVNVVEDNDAPYFQDLEETKDLTINTTNLKEGISAYDDVCGDVTDRIKVTLGPNFKFDEEGYYDVIYSVTDLNGNETTKTVTIHVYDDEAPVIDVLKTSFKLEIHKTLNIDEFIRVTDNYDEEVDYTLHDNDLDVNKVGTYQIEISSIDEAGNKASKKISIYVHDPNPDVFYENPVVLGSIVAITVSGLMTLIGHSMSKKRRKY